MPLHSGPVAEFSGVLMSRRSSGLQAAMHLLTRFTI